ncbi:MULTISPECIES: histidine phosphatase family protein [Nocardiaceae]|uniref:Phosphomutase (TIGR03848 family) n=1 Tax=Rhodococcoides corynebacterioides TaxID=53972 RepID=A0ABS2KRM8_9NOCA|nr:MULTISPECIES: histidine phosphatase family protein [Rhodococcus]MBM7414609.1 putative phosphomutase (TIGR03848 family) [Rhodococcus corynebacterioides]MBP1117071.1 putative phosphomutase (TIGR03848 family) [Rhodococcus sp. PvP016]
MTVILLRHGRSTSNTAGTLAGRSDGVELDDLGREQAERVVARLEVLPLAAIVRSPLLRCEQTVAPLAAARELDPVVEDRLLEVDYGEWTGKPIKDLLGEPLWKVVQQHPSAAVFPGGEGLADVQIRAVRAIREIDARLAAEHGSDVLWVACSHGDVIKSVLADALGSHLDQFQRIVVDPASISVVRYTETRPFVHRLGDLGGDLTQFVPKPPAETDATAEAPSDQAPTASESDAVPGGSTGQ